MENNNNILIQPEMIPLTDIYLDTDFNCRGFILPIDVIPLARNIEDNGLLQPIVIQPFNKVPGKKYRIVLGHRRFTAYKVLKRESIPSVIRPDLSDDQAKALNLIENIERKDLNILQEANGIKDFLKRMNLQQIANMLKVSIGWVDIRSRLLELEPEIQAEASAGLLTQQQIKDLWSMPTKDMRFEAVRTIKDRKLKGEKGSLKLKKPKQNVLAKKRRDPTEIGDMLEHIYDNLGASLTTRGLAWAAGNISDLELYRSIREEAQKQGKPYAIPASKMSEFTLSGGSIKS